MMTVQEYMDSWRKLYRMLVAEKGDYRAFGMVIHKGRTLAYPRAIGQIVQMKASLFDLLIAQGRISYTE
jgi:hypothetical protein